MMYRISTFIDSHRRWLTGAAIGAVFLVAGLPLFMTIWDSRQKYDWNDTYYGNVSSDAPFGAKYYMEHLKEMWKGRVECDSDFLYSLKKHKGIRCNYLMLYIEDRNHYDDDSDTYYDYFMSADTLSDQGIDFARRTINAIGKGNNMVFSTQCKIVPYSLLMDTEGGPCFSIQDFTESTKPEVKPSKERVRYGSYKRQSYRDSCAIWDDMLWFSVHDASDSGYAALQLHDYYKPYGNVSSDMLITSDDNYFYAASRRFGKGRALLCGIPALFSNYALSVPDIQRVSDRLLLSTLDTSLPLVIINEDTGVTDSADSDDDWDNIFFVMFGNPATKVAMYLLIVMLVLAVVVNSRRRRHAVRAVKIPANSSLSYVRHLATLYSRKSDYKELLAIEQRKILYALRREYRFDIRTHSFTLPSEYSAFIAASKGGSENDIRTALTTLESLTSSHDGVSDEGYVACLQLLNDALYSLENK